MNFDAFMFPAFQQLAAAAGGCSSQPPPSAARLLLIDGQPSITLDYRLSPSCLSSALSPENFSCAVDSKSGKFFFG
ncbi:hypothetical protein ACU8KH_01657 [Lachancea thermotolerans]